MASTISSPFLAVNPGMNEMFDYVTTGCSQLCCIRKRKTAEQREYEDLRAKLAEKQEEVRRLQAQCDQLNGGPQPTK